MATSSEASKSATIGWFAPAPRAIDWAPNSTSGVWLSARLLVRSSRGNVVGSATSTVKVTAGTGPAARGNICAGERSSGTGGPSSGSAASAKLLEAEILAARQVVGIVQRKAGNVLTAAHQFELQVGHPLRLADVGRQQSIPVQSAAAMPTAWAALAQVAITRVEPKATWEALMIRPARNRLPMFRL